LLPPRALLARLEQRLPVLTGGPRDVPARQQTLRDTIAWSYDLLRPEERALFRSLAVFAGGFTLAAGCWVSGFGGPGSAAETRNPEADALDLVGSLVDKSLLRRADRDDGEPRFTMLETIREYGLEQLGASGEGESVRQRHARYFLGMTDEPWRGLAGAETVAWLDRVEREHDNLRAALGWLRDYGPLEAGLSLSASLWWFWSVRGYLTEGQVWLRTFLDRPDPGTASAPERARALFGAGVLARLQTDYEGSQALLEEALGIARANGDDPCAADVLVELGDVAYSRQELAIARGHLAEALAIRRRVGDPWGTVDALNRLARVMLRQGAFAEARRGLKEARTLAEVVGARDLLAAAMYYSGEVASEIGEWSAAQHDYAEGLRLFRDLGYHRWIARAMEGLASLAAIQHDSVRALRLAGAAAAIREASGQPLAPIEGQRLERRLGTIRAALDQRSAAAAWEAGRVQPLREAIEEALASGEPPARTSRADVVAMPVRPDRSAGLAPREREVTVLIARGYSNGRIGDELSLSRRTVESVVTAIFNKLGLSSRAEVAVWAVEHGLHATGPA
jgi:DNA-binding CsgD family transcriptional regulator